MNENLALVLIVAIMMSPLILLIWFGLKDD